MNSRLKAIFLIASISISSSAWAERIQAYFNNDSSYSYVDKYRNIEKQGSDLEAILIQQINSAKRSVVLAVQELRLPKVVEALINRKHRGLDVRVVLENQYNNDILTMGMRNYESETVEQDASKYYDLFAFIDTNFDGKISRKEMEERDAIFMLKQAGIEIKDDTSDASLGSGLMHHKFVVIDDHTVVISSANFTLSCIHGDFLNDASQGNANGMLVIEHKGVAQTFAEEFDIMWGGEDGKLGSRFGIRKPYRGPRTFNVDGTDITVQFSPTSKGQHWPRTVNGLIGKTLKRATQSVNMALFVYSDQEISEILRKQVIANPKLEINVLVEPKFAYREYSELLDLWGLQLLDSACRYEAGNHPWRRYKRVQGGVPTLNRGDVLHHKFAVVDESIVIFGSQNWSDSANFINDEFAVIVENKNIAAKFLDEFDRLFEDARLGPPQSLKDKIKLREQQCSKI